MKNLSKETIKKMKIIAYAVISKEFENYPNMKVHLFPVTNFEYYTRCIKQFIKICADNGFHPNKNEFLGFIKNPFKYAGFNYNFEENSKIESIICVFINKIEKYKSPYVNFLRTCYHEARHIIQENFGNNSYAKFLQYIDRLLMRNSYADYDKSHDNYSIEIGANLYATFRVEEAIEKLEKMETIKNSNRYKLDKCYIEDLKKAYKLDYMLFDAVNHLNKALNVVNKKKLKINDEIPIFHIFTNDDNSFKPIHDMVKNPNFEKLDKRIIYTVLSSDLFLSSVDMEQLSDEELDTLNESLQYTYTIYNNQYQFIFNEFNNDNIKFKFFIKATEKLIKNIKKIKNHLLLLNSAQNSKQYQYEFIKSKLKEKNVEIL